MKKIIYAIFAGVLLVAVSCVEEESPETYLQIVQSDIDFDAAGGSGEILISTNAASVGASSDKSWVTVDGTSSESVRFTVSSSDREFSRVANLTITADGVSQEVTISQMGLIFDITSDELSDGLEIAAAGGSVSFTYSTTGQKPVITIPETDNWLSCTVADETVTLSAEVNLSGADRSTEVSVTAGWKTMSLSVSQARVPLLEQTEFSFSGDPVTDQIVNPTEWAAQVNWTTIAVEGDWITAEKTSEGAISFSVSENTTGEIRNGTINMLDETGEIVETVTISQHVWNYSYFLGEWQMNYIDDDGADAVVSVMISQYELGESYILSVPDASLGEIQLLVSYDHDNATLALNAQYIGRVASIGYFWWVVLTDDGNLTWSTAAGMNMVYNMDPEAPALICEDNGGYAGGSASGFSIYVFSAQQPSQNSVLGYWENFDLMSSLTR